MRNAQAACARRALLAVGSAVLLIVSLVVASYIGTNTKNTNTNTKNTKSKY